MRKWGVNFDGKADEDGEEFLKRIQEGRRLVRVSDKELFSCLPFFLGGVVLHWFRNTLPHRLNFRDFENSWMVRFSDPDFQFALYESLRKWTQHEKERVADYLKCIKAMFNRLEPALSEERQIELAVRNMIPRMQLKLSEEYFRDWAQLEFIATRKERSF